MAKKIDIDKLAELKEGLDGTKESQDKYNKALDRLRKEKFMDVFPEYRDLFNM